MRVAKVAKLREAQGLPVEGARVAKRAMAPAAVEAAAAAVEAAPEWVVPPVRVESEAKEARATAIPAPEEAAAMSS
jgi:hypothetical protein